MTRIEKAKRQISRIPFKLTDNECHIPTNRTPNKHGYINTNFNKKQTKLHRLVAFAYLGLDIDNLLELALHKNECNNRACFNIDHLYVGNHKQNMKDTIQIGHHHQLNKVFCKFGHKYDKFKIVKNKIHRRCSECRKRRRQ